jgi:hypothetical protein
MEHGFSLHCIEVKIRKNTRVTANQDEDIFE